MQIPAELHIAPSIAESAIPATYTHPSVDVRHFVGTDCGIDTVHEIISASKRRGFNATYTFVLAFHTITREAQNALLKLTEEPPENMRVILVVPHERVLIPTLRSRLLLIGSDIRSVSQKSIPYTLGERLELIRTLHSNEDAEVLADLMVTFLHHARTYEHVPAVARAIRLLSQHTNAHRGLQKRMLEHLALSLATV